MVHEWQREKVRKNSELDATWRSERPKTNVSDHRDEGGAKVSDEGAGTEPRDERADYDGSYRKLMTNEELFRQLLERFVDEKIRGELDFETLERVETSFVKRDMQKRHSDLFWKLERKSARGEYVYCVVMLEFQSSPDAFMALRVLEYAVEFYRQQVAGDQDHVKTHGFPPLLPLVLHHSDETWSAKTALSELIAVDEDDPLALYQPGQRYLLLDEHELGKEVPADEENIPAQLFRLHNVDDPEDLSNTFSTLLMLFESNNIPLELLASWAKHSLSHTNPTAKLYRDELIDIITPKVLPMFPQNLFKMFEQEMLKGLEKGIEKGLEQGIEQGREEGVEQGSLTTQLRMLGRQLERKFGARSERMEELLGLTFEQREHLADLLIDADDEQALFEQVRQSV